MPQWRIQDFPWGGGRTNLVRGRQLLTPLCFIKFASQNERIGTLRVWEPPICLQITLLGFHLTHIKLQVADPGGAPGVSPKGPNSFVFTYKFYKTYISSLGVGAPLRGERPLTENPGSVTHYLIRVTLNMIVSYLC